MKYAALQDLVTATDNSLRQARRNYRLSERAHLAVSTCTTADSGPSRVVVLLYPMGPPGAPPPSRLGRPMPPRHLSVGEMTAQEIAKMAEYRSMIADWESGKIDALPPSNLIDSPDEF